ncbi:tripartite tricarboxylate transporter TctB family protein [Aquabacter sp. CN5-332]|uniref:tripartite tricarboxylate transporter TctB family protein n=1 Tax=Aquabacter sp. CN5-332 TaxID=3156608 RepID=UPI0032B623D1
MRVNDLILALLVLVGAVALAAAARTFPPIPGQQYGADVFPLAVAGGLFLCGAWLAFTTLRDGAGRAVSLSWAAEPGAVVRVAGTLGLVVLYMVAAPALGFIAASTLVLVALFLLLRVHMVVAVPVAAIASVCVFYAFAHLLRVPLPRGLIEGLL